MATFVRSYPAVSLAPSPRRFQAIAVGGVVAGVLDLIYAIVMCNPHKPILIPQTIASGVLGRISYA